MSRDTKKWVHGTGDLPDGEHFAILYFSSVYVPGDERSRTNPGHGYPERYESVVEYVAFTDRAEWEAEVQREMTSQYGRKDFKAIYVRPASISTKVEVKVT